MNSTMKTMPVALTPMSPTRFAPTTAQGTAREHLVASQEMNPWLGDFKTEIKPLPTTSHSKNRQIKRLNQITKNIYKSNMQLP